MAWLHENNAVQQLSDKVILYDLDRIRGTKALLNRIPDHLSGVYAWYRCFTLNAEARNDPEVFLSSILSRSQSQLETSDRHQNS